MPVGLEAAIRRTIPYALRVEVVRLRHVPRRWMQRRFVARARAGDGYPFLLARRASPMRRALAVSHPQSERATWTNVRAAAGRLDRLVIRPHEVFSYHATVGRPSRLRGFRRGLELRNERLASGVGGGACKVANLVYQLALAGGMKIIERHRHSLDLYPDRARSVPFGCGATVFYNYADLRFENPLAQPVQLLLRIRGADLVGELRTVTDPGWTAEIYETDHRLFRERGEWIRENRIRRRFVRRDGTTLLDEEVAHNRARLLYEPQIAGSPVEPHASAVDPSGRDELVTKVCCAL